MLSCLAGVLGFPVAHSRSPAMMNAAFRSLRLDWRYLRLPAPAGRFDEIGRALPSSGYRGVNVTLPHKRAAYELADELGEAAAAIGAVNTLSFGPGGVIRGENTDAPGLLDALGEPVPATALVLGAGGAGRAAAWALREEGAEVTVWNRTPEKASALADELGVRHDERPTRPTDLLVNATSVGLRPGDALESLPHVEAATVVDFAYGARPTALIRRAAARGARTVEGPELLVRQGARSFELWTGRPAPLDAMRAAVIQPHI